MKFMKKFYDIQNIIFLSTVCDLLKENFVAF